MKTLTMAWVFSVITDLALNALSFLTRLQKRPTYSHPMLDTFPSHGSLILSGRNWAVGMNLLSFPGPALQSPPVVPRRPRKARAYTGQMRREKDVTSRPFKLEERSKTATTQCGRLHDSRGITDREAGDKSSAVGRGLLAAHEEARSLEGKAEARDDGIRAEPRNAVPEGWRSKRQGGVREHSKHSSPKARDRESQGTMWQDWTRAGGETRGGQAEAAGPHLISGPQGFGHRIRD